jgi:molybdopterin-guanine dinucleotide biosynthesis protein A
MGQDKALVQVDGEALALRVARALRAAGFDPITLVGRQPGLQALGLRVIAEAAPLGDHHPLWGVAAALRDSTAPLALICPCDLVDLRAEDLRALIDAGTPAVGVAGGERNPLLAWLPASMAERAAVYAQDGRSARSFVEGVPGRVLRPGPLRNANRPEDLTLERPEDGGPPADTDSPPPLRKRGSPGEEGAAPERVMSVPSSTAICVIGLGAVAPRVLVEAITGSGWSLDDDGQAATLIVVAPGHEGAGLARLTDGEAVPGFLELLRGLAFTAVGARAMFLSAGAAQTKRGLVYVLPTDPEVALLAWERLIRPNLPEHELRPPVRGAAEAAAPAPAGAAPRVQLTMSASPSAAATPAAATPAATATEAPPAAAALPAGPARLQAAEIGRPPAVRPEDPPVTGWMLALAALGGSLDRGAWGGLPETLEGIAPVQNVLDAAGDRGVLTHPDGRAWLAFGFPDLRRPQSKVLLIRDAEPYGEIIALHRQPRRVGVCIYGEPSYLPGADLDPEAVSLERTGRAPAQAGTLFAVESDAVYLLRGNKVFRWDGRKETDMGRPAQALASLILAWSTR